jgi:IPT/TIG domain
MSLFKRHIGRRVTLVGVAVALLVLGLEAPAFAVAPTIASFSPGSGPVGCVVVITGTNFLNPAVSGVTFNATAAVDFSVNSDTEIWAKVPAGATDGAIHVTNASATADSTTEFDVSTSAGSCAPTVTSFTPACGSTNTAVKIIGTNLLASADPATTPSEVRFADYVGATTLAGHIVPNAESPTELNVLVPSGAGDGPIRVTTFATAGGTAFATTPFAVPPPDCPVAGGIARNITLRLRDALVARGKVSASSATAPAGCTAAVPVKIQRRRAGGGWRTVGSTTTSDTGGYRKKIRNRHGKYRSLAPKLTLTTGEVCSRAVSKVVRH